MKGWDPSHQIKPQKLVWSGPRTAKDYLDLNGGNRGVISRRQLILKVTFPAKTSLQKPNPLLINTDIELLSPWSSRA